MRIARFNGGRIGVVSGDHIVDVTEAAGVDPGEWPPVGMTRLIARFGDRRERIVAAAAAGQGVPFASVRLETPVPWPNKIIAYPVNYHAHGREMSSTYRANNQGFFLKPNSALSGPADPVVLPNVPGREVHHECELALIVGKEVRSLPRERWQEAVFGYACLLDMVIRGKEERVFRKGFDTFCPVGPYITTADEVGDASGLRGRLWVNGDLRQDANTRDLVLDLAGMVETASAVMTLYPGDIIATGTPAGVGPVTDGDRIRIEFERVGEMTVDVVQGENGWTEVFAEAYTPNIIRP